MTSLDAHGQPLNLYLNARHRLDRDVHELLGMIRGVLVDGVVSANEVAALDEFMARNLSLELNFPGNVLSARLSRIMHDGRIDDDELTELRALLEETIGAHAPVEEQAATALPLTDPAPTLVFPERTYVVTGKFIYGARKAVTAAILSRGGRCEDTITLRTDVLLIGTLASRDWKQSSFGRKIEKAVELRGKGRQIAIVGEEHWASQLT